MANQIERQIDLPRTPEELWLAITDSGTLAGWLADEVYLELVPGGEAHFRDGDVVREGWVEEVLPPGGITGVDGVAARLAFWWSAADEPASRVELTLIPLAESLTRLRVVEAQPLEVLDLVGMPLPGSSGRSFGPALIAA
jgi:uncharacterized protein YndB with AHSA1/START domain